MCPSLLCVKEFLCNGLVCMKSSVCESFWLLFDKVSVQEGLCLKASMCKSSWLLCVEASLLKEVWKLNFRQDGEMEMARPGRNSDVEKHNRENTGVRKGRKDAKHCVFPVLCGSGWSKGRLAKAAGAETSGQMRREKLHVAVTRSTF